MNSDQLKLWLKRGTQRAGFDILRYPSARLLSGHTAILLKELEITCVVDVGANTGQYGAFLRSIGFSGQIISFEPVAASYAALAKRTASDPKWEAMQVALGTEDATAPINVTRDSVLSSLRAPLSDEQVASWSERLRITHVEKVAVRRLDSVWPQVVGGVSDVRVFLKMDTQGWDLEVLKGATGCLPFVVAMQSEVSVIPIYSGMPDWSESMMFMRDLGYQPTGLFPVTYHGGVRSMEFDCVMVRAFAL